MNTIKSKWLLEFKKHNTKGRLFIILSVVSFVFAVCAGLPLLLSALDFEKLPQIVISLLTFGTFVPLGIKSWSKAQRQIKTVPFGWGAEITTLNGKRMLISRDVRGTWIRDETAEARQHYMGDQVKLHDLRNRTINLSHYSIASDGVGVSVMTSVVWSIEDLQDYLHQSQSPMTILENAIHRHLTNHITCTPSRDLTRNTERIEWAVQRQTAFLTQYGIRINEVQVIAIETLTHVTTSQSQAEPTVVLRLTAPK